MHFKPHDIQPFVLFQCYVTAFYTKHQLKTIQKIEHNLAYMDYAMIFCL